MQLDPEEQRNGAIWFVVSGLTALAVLVILVSIDVSLTYSDKEIKHAEVMRELRLAQSSLQTGSVDPRKSR